MGRKLPSNGVDPPEISLKSVMGRHMHEEVSGWSAAWEAASAGRDFHFSEDALFSLPKKLCVVPTYHWYHTLTSMQGWFCINKAWNKAFPSNRINSTVE